VVDPGIIQNCRVPSTSPSSRRSRSSSSNAYDADATTITVKVAEDCESYRRSRRRDRDDAVPLPRATLLDSAEHCLASGCRALAVVLASAIGDRIPRCSSLLQRTPRNGHATRSYEGTRLVQRRAGRRFRSKRILGMSFHSSIWQVASRSFKSKHWNGARSVQSRSLDFMLDEQKSSRKSEVAVA